MSSDYAHLFVRVRPFLGQEANIPDRDERAGFPAVEVRYAQDAHSSRLQSGSPSSPTSSNSIHSPGFRTFDPNSSQPRRVVCVLDPLNTYRVKVRYDYMDDCFTNGIDESTGAASTQAEVFQSVGRRCLSYFQDGINSSIVSYGAGNTGKSYTMFGPLSVSNSVPAGSGTPALITEQCGIIPRLIAAAMDWSAKQQNVVLTLTGVAVVMERIYDIFAEPNAVVELRLRDDGRGPFLQNLAHVAIPDGTEEDPNVFLRRVYKIFHRVLYGNGIGGMKPHLVVTLNAEQRFAFAEGNSTLTKRRFSRMTLVDIAGSGNASGNDAMNIQLSPQDVAKNNKAMFTFKRCVEALGEDPAKPSSRPPYRDSVFTWLLSDVLGGNCVTHLLLCVSPFHRHIIDSTTTLALGTRARCIPVAAKVNEDEETVKLREMQSEMDNVAKQITVVNHAVQMVTEQLRERGERIDRLTQAEEQIQLVHEAEASAFESEKLLNTARRGRFTRVHEREVQRCNEMDKKVETLREQVRRQQEEKHVAEKILREKEHARFRECGIEQEVLAAFEEVQSALDTCDRNVESTRLANEKHHTRKTNAHTELANLQTELSTKRMEFEQLKENTDKTLDTYQRKTQQVNTQLDVLRKEKESLVGVHQFNSSANAEAKDAIEKLEKEVETLTTRRAHLERERDEMKSGCACIIA